MFIEDCRVKSNKRIVEDIYKMELVCEKIAKEAKPGQFLQVKVNEVGAPLLRRPISINEIIVDENVIVIYYKVVGKGTKILSEIEAGKELNVIGPLGRGFDIDYENKNIAVVGGGIGIAPLLELNKALCSKNTVYTFLGYNDNPYLVEDFENNSNNVEISTVTGKVGYKGFIIDVLEEALKNNDIDIIYTCGPTPMIKRVVDIADRENIKCQVSLEERMACGIGACLGCSIETTDGKMKKVCADGPVFWSDEVIIND